jgi:predicted DNA binding CopG/RHH family protein
MTRARERSDRVDQKVVDDVIKARREGRLEVGPLDLLPSSEEQREDARRDAEGWRKTREAGGRTVPVTIRMEPEMIQALKAQATELGVRGYQTLMKQWIEERLQGEPTISIRMLRQLISPLAALIEWRSKSGQARTQRVFLGRRQDRPESILVGAAVGAPTEREASGEGLEIGGVEFEGAGIEMKDLGVIESGDERIRMVEVDLSIEESGL